MANQTISLTIPDIDLMSDDDLADLLRLRDGRWSRQTKDMLVRFGTSKLNLNRHGQVCGRVGLALAVAVRKHRSLRELLTKELTAVEEAAERPGHFSLGFGFDLYRNKEALDILVLGYKSVFESARSYVRAAVRIEAGARPDPEPAEPREIVPYIAGEMPEGASLTVRNVTTVMPDRTFWRRC